VKRFLSTLLILKIINKNLFVSHFVEISAADGIQPFFSEKRVLEGADVTLSCNYTASYITGLQWYRQPENLLIVFPGSESKRQGRFEATMNKTAVSLEISSTAVSDSALYYCALEPTVIETHQTLY
uniref:Ig-like domain-containing protein n=1 Tax=Astyanax mexicanus TaxID=7994 RepID=A0A3B1IF28_ASTMX